MVLQQIDDLNPNSVPIDEIFPDDLLQFILSFADFSNTKKVNKKWKLLSNKTEKSFMTKMRKTYESSDLDDKNLNTTWILDGARTELYPLEVKLGFKMYKIICQMLSEIVTMEIDCCYIMNSIGFRNGQQTP